MNVSRGSLSWCFAFGGSPRSRLPRKFAISLNWIDLMHSPFHPSLPVACWYVSLVSTCQAATAHSDSSDAVGWELQLQRHGEAKKRLLGSQQARGGWLEQSRAPKTCTKIACSLLRLPLQVKPCCRSGRPSSQAGLCLLWIGLVLRAIWRSTLTECLLSLC